MRSIYPSITSRSGQSNTARIRSAIVMRDLADQLREVAEVAGAAFLYGGPFRSGSKISGKSSMMVPLTKKPITNLTMTARMEVFSSASVIAAKRAAFASASARLHVLPLFGEAPGENVVRAAGEQDRVSRSSARCSFVRFWPSRSLRTSIAPASRRWARM